MIRPWLCPHRRLGCDRSACWEPSAEAIERFMLANELQAAADWMFHAWATWLCCFLGLVLAFAHGLSEPAWDLSAEFERPARRKGAHASAKVKRDWDGPSGKWPLLVRRRAYLDWAHGYCDAPEDLPIPFYDRRLDARPFKAFVPIRLHLRPAA